MTVTHRYTYTNNRQLWRLLLSDTNKLIVEDRDTEQKQVYFNCLDAATGKDIFRNYQLKETFWVGIEVIYKDIIYFHKFVKPDMPEHKHVIALDIKTQQVLWENDRYSFLFIYDDKVCMFRSEFNGKSYFAFDYLTGELVEELGNDPMEIDILQRNSQSADQYKDYLFPDRFHDGVALDKAAKSIIHSYSDGFEIAGSLEYAIYQELLMFNYYTKISKGNLINRFIAYDLHKNKKVFEHILNSEAKAFVPDSFFMKDNLVFILKEKTNLLVYSIEQEQ
ncbi:MAG: DUF4905 domain-containing protein [Ignavibacteria bacterium]